MLVGSFRQVAAIVCNGKESTRKCCGVSFELVYFGNVIPRYKTQKNALAKEYTKNSHGQRMLFQPWPWVMWCAMCETFSATPALTDCKEIEAERGH